MALDKGMLDIQVVLAPTCLAPIHPILDESE